MKHPPTTVHNYLRKIADLQAVGGFQPNAGYTLDIDHDDWCDALNEVGCCNCDPSITVRDGILPPLRPRS